MSGCALEFHSFFPWNGSIGGILGFPYMLARVDVKHTKHKLIDKGMSVKSLVDIEKTKYKMASLGSKKYQITQYTDEDVMPYESGTHTFDVIQYTEEQVFIVPDENILEI